MSSQKGTQIIAKSYKDEEFVVEEADNNPPVSAATLKMTENMCEMEELSEAAILHNLRLRFEENLIYTYISSILVSVNPFKMLPIYSPAIMADYRAKLKAMEKMSPHVYALADCAFKQLSVNNKNQSVIISGESGAGKTEATKLVLQYMAEMSGQSSEVEQQLLQANPIVEAFGNAKTVRNNNSSRFGKWVEVSFTPKLHIGGAQIINYLLEQSRIVEPGKGERNYHIFYQLCIGATNDQREAWKIGDVDSFRVCVGGECTVVDSIDDESEYKDLIQAMHVLKFSTQEQNDLLRTTAAVMHVGNIEFDGADKAKVTNMDVLNTAAVLLGVPADKLSTALVSQSKAMGKERVLTFLGKVQSEGNRDALCKAIYSNQFDWLIKRLNTTMYKKIDNSKQAGVLDIFGFEIFDVNRFEQFCINFANEKMQQHFNEHIFSMEQAEYKNDHIDVAHVEFVDNQLCLDMIEKKGGIMMLCDDELKVPKGDDNTLLDRLNSTFAKNKYYVASKKREPKFAINHYAGAVDYNIGKFMEKNLNKLNPDLAEVLTMSTYSHVKMLAPDASSATVSKKFRDQLSQLMAALHPTDPHFIRCIKSNAVKVADNFDGPFVLRQLRYLGLKEVVNIRQLGYPVRRPHKEFCDRYRILAPDAKSTNFKVFAENIMGTTGQEVKNWRVGDTKVFVRNSVQTSLEAMRDKLLANLITELQSLAKAKVWRQRYLRLRKIEAELKVALNSEDVAVLDDVIERYESLQMNLNPKLLAEAIKRRNYLVKKLAAEKALKAAIKSKDAQLLKSSLDTARDAEMSGSALFKEVEGLLTKVTLLASLQTEAFEKRDLEVTKRAVALASEVQLDGAKEKQAVALLKALEEEAKVKAKLAEAIASRDLDALRHALQVAMNHKSGAMVGNALQKALDSGLADDPLIKKAMALEKTLDHEVSVKQMQSELEVALKTGDFDIITNTVKMAHEKGMGDHDKTKACEAKLKEILKIRSIQSNLIAAVARKDMGDLAKAIAEAAENKLTHLSEYESALKCQKDIQEAVKKVEQAQKDAEVARKRAEDELNAKREEEKRMGIIQEDSARLEEERVAKEKAKLEQAKLDAVMNEALAMGIGQNKDLSAAIQQSQESKQQADAEEVLKNAIEAKDVSFLENAISRAREAKLPATNHFFKEARQLLSELKADAIRAQQELEAANKAAQEEIKIGPETAAEKEEKRVKAITVVKPATSADNDKYREIAQSSFVVAEYSKLEYELQSFPGLRSIAEFGGKKAKDKKNNIGMLKHTKENIPTSLTKLDSSLEVEAQNMFKSVQGFMHDRHWTYPESLVPEILESIAVHRPLRTEVYVQVMKQLCNNSDKKSRESGWVLLCILSEIIAPDAALLKYVLHFTTDEDATADFQLHAIYVRNVLEKTAMRGIFEHEPVGEGEPPKKIREIEYVKAFSTRVLKGHNLVIYLPDSSIVQQHVDPWVSAADLIPVLASQLHIKDCSGLGIYQIQDGASGSIDYEVVEPEECLLDFDAAKQQQEVEVVVEKKQEKKSVFSFFTSKKKPELPVASKALSHFVLTQRFYFKPLGQTNDATLRKLMANQYARDVAQGALLLTDEQAVLFAGYHRILNKLPRIGAPVNVPDEWSSLQIDSQPKNQKKDDKFSARVTSRAQAITETGDSAVIKYMELVKDLPTFGAQYFRVGNNSDKEYPPLMILGINILGLNLLNTSNKALEAHFPLMSILGWTSTPMQVMLKVKLNRKKEGKSSTLLRLRTSNARMGKEICSLLYIYCAETMKAVLASKKDSADPKP